MTQSYPSNALDAWEGSFECLSGVVRICGASDFSSLSRFYAKYSGLRHLGFGDCSFYHTMTGRRGLWVLENQHGAVVICWHPTVLGRLVLFEPLARDRFRCLEEVVKVLPPPPVGVQVSRLRPDLQSAIIRRKSMEGLDGSVQFCYLHNDGLDTLFPERVISTRLVSSCSGSRLGHVRQRLRLVREFCPRFVKLDSVLLDNVENVLRVWRRSYWARHGRAPGESGELLIEPYVRLASVYLRGNCDGASCYLVEVCGEFRGLVMVAPIDQVSCGLFCNVVDTAFAGLSEFAVWRICVELADSGFEKLNMGGSETSSLDRFKRKFFPTESYSLAAVLLAT